MTLSPHFTFEELTLTTHRGLLEQNQDEARGRMDALRSLCSTLLEPLRAHFAAPVIVHSGFRCAALNAAIGGSPSSQHMLGEAADLHVNGVAHEDVWEWIWRESGLPFGQCLLEGHVRGVPSWVHLSLGEPWRPTRKNRQHFVLTAAA